MPDQMDLNADRRKFDAMTLLQNFVMPAIIASVSAYVSVQVTMSVLSLEVEYLKRDFAELKLITEVLRENTAELRARGVWMEAKNKDDERQDRDIELIKSDNLRLWQFVHKMEREQKEAHK